MPSGCLQSSSMKSGKTQVCWHAEPTTKQLVPPVTWKCSFLVRPNYKQHTMFKQPIKESSNKETAFCISEIHTASESLNIKEKTAGSWTPRSLPCCCYHWQWRQCCKCRVQWTIHALTVSCTLASGAWFSEEMMTGSNIFWQMLTKSEPLSLRKWP